MKETIRADGAVTFRLPDSASKPTDIKQPRAGTRRGTSTPAESAALEMQILLDALAGDGEAAGSGIQIVDKFSVDLGDTNDKPRRRGSAGKAGNMEIDVSLSADEGAVILIEQEGTYEWHLPEKTHIARGPQRGRRGSRAIERKTAAFRIPIGEGSAPKPGRGVRRGLRGPITNFIKGKVLGFVLKFVVRKAVGAISNRLEKGVNAGPVIVNSHDDAESWQQHPDYLSVNLPIDRPARILLLVHGTFSSTLGSYGALATHPAGQRFLESALSHYDAVLGYDHYTLSDTPDKNAEAIFNELLKLDANSPGIEIDAISFSRGGLVYRYLTEHIAPFENTRLSFRKAIFVGCTNNGTELANDENWKNLVDFYTNMVAGGTRLLGFIPGATLPAKIFSQSVKIIGSMVTYIAQEGVANNAVPGVAAMEPAGAFVQAINTPPATRVQPGAKAYYAIGSDFEPDASTSAGKLGKRLVFKVADGVVDRLMGETNDLVVNNESMFVVDPLPRARLAESLLFEDNNQIYHTVYFQQPQAARQLSDWLGLLNKTRGKAAQSPRTWWKSAVTDDFLVLPGSITAAKAARQIKHKPTRFVVIQRSHAGEQLHYGMPRKLLQDSLGPKPPKDVNLIDLLGLHEWQATGIALDAALDNNNATDLFHRASSQPPYVDVVVGEHGPVGVLARPEVLDADEILATASASPNGPRGKPVRTARRPATGNTRQPRIQHERAPQRPASRGSRSPTSHGPSHESTASGATAPVTTALCHVHASMDDEAVIGKKTPVEVVLSRDTIMRAAGVSGSAKVNVAKDIIVQVLARKHCVVSGDARAEVPVPATGEEIELYFDIIAKQAGIGEVDVIARQGNRPLVNLTLRPKFVKKASSGEVGTAVAEADAQPLDKRRELPNVLYIREGEMGSKRVLHFHFESQSLNKIVQATSEPFADADARLAYITNLYQEIEDFWAEDDQQYEAFMRRLQARGVQLFDELMPKEIRQVLWDSRDSIDTIQVFSDEPFIPWELAYLKQPGKKAKRNSQFLAEKGLVRWLTDAGQFPATRLRLREGKAAYIIPKYPRGSNYELDGAQLERQMLEDMLGAQAVVANSSSVHNALEQPGKFDILHFACHGVADSDSIWNAGLLMKGKMNGSTYKQDSLLSAEVEAFADLQETGEAGPIIFLNACQVGRQGYGLTGTGGFARAFLKSGAGAFIGAHWSVGDTEALEFSTTLYKQLLAKKNMMTAVAAARKAAKSKQELTWLAYVVYADPYARLNKM